MRFTAGVSLALLMVACGGGEGVDGGVTRDAGQPSMDAGRGDTDAGETDAGDTDAGDTDAGDTDAGETDAGSSDAGSSDAGSSDAGSSDAGTMACDAMDAMEGRACGPTERPGRRYIWNGRTCEFAAWCECIGADCGERYVDEAACLAVYGTCRPACRTDADCPSGSEWCESGVCEACDNSGLVCLISCSPRGWGTYRRNGCSPCECAPPSECAADSECRSGEQCYAGEFCWCADGGRRPECCLGNICSPSGCAEPPPTGCATRGCARGDSCMVGAGACSSSSCGCTGSNWRCTRDCGGGTCVSP